MSALLVVAGLLVTLGFAVVRWGLDTRDGQDWHPSCLDCGH